MEKTKVRFYLFCILVALIVGCSSLPTGTKLHVVDLWLQDHKIGYRYNYEEKIVSMPDKSFRWSISYESRDNYLVKTSVDAKGRVLSKELFEKSGSNFSPDSTTEIFRNGTVVNTIKVRYDSVKDIYIQENASSEFESYFGTYRVGHVGTDYFELIFNDSWKLKNGKTGIFDNTVRYYRNTSEGSTDSQEFQQNGELYDTTKLVSVEKI